MVCFSLGRFGLVKLHVDIQDKTLNVFISKASKKLPVRRNSLSVGNK